MTTAPESSDFDIVSALRERACPAGLPWTAEAPEEDHGHTDCWLQHQAADEIERLRNLIITWAEIDNSLDYVWDLGDWDAIGALESVFKEAGDALRKAVGR